MTLAIGELEPGEDGAGTVAEIAHRIRPIMRRRDRFVPYAPNRFALALVSCPAAEAEAAIKRLFSLLTGEAGASAKPRPTSLVARLRIARRLRAGPRGRRPRIAAPCRGSPRHGPAPNNAAVRDYQAGLGPTDLPSCGTAPES